MEELGKVSIQLLLKEPFYGHVISNLVKKVDNTIPTMCLRFIHGERMELHVNETFWKKTGTNEKHLYGLLKHEILHFVFKHPLTLKSYQHRSIYNIAADIVVNQLISDEQLPLDALTIEHFPGLDLLEDQSVKYYYDKLLNLYHENISNSNNTDDDWQRLKQLLDTQPEPLESHNPWLDSGSESQKQIYSNSVDGIINQSAEKLTNQQRMSLPQSVLAEIQITASHKKASVNWRRIMRLFSNNSSRTVVKNSIRRPSKRYATVPGNKIVKRNKILVAIDSSGSIGKTEYNLFFSELYHIYRTGAEIRVVECDTKITNIYAYKGHTPETVSGGGYTDFNAPLEYANTVWNSDAIIYFTDGYAITPEIKPRPPVLWVISHEGIAEKSSEWDSLPGKKVRINTY